MRLLERENEVLCRAAGVSGTDINQSAWVRQDWNLSDRVLLVAAAGRRT